MKRLIRCLLITLLAGGASILPATASGTIWNDWKIVSEFHTDLSIGHQTGTGEWSLKVDRGDSGIPGEAHTPDSTILLVNPEAIRTVPENVPPAFSFLGEPGDSYYLLPTVERAKVLFLGFNAYGIPTNHFSGPFGGEVNLTLADYAGEGPFFLYTASAAGPNMFMDTRPDAPPFGSVTEISGGHSHYNWVFKERGIHILSLEPSGERVSDGELLTGDPTAFFFLVDPRPRDWWVLDQFREDALTARAGMTCDASGDGFPNLLAYAFGHDPEEPGLAYQPRVEMVEIGEARHLSLVFRLAAGEEGRDDRSDLAITVQAGTDLADWTTLTPEEAPWTELEPAEDGTPRFRVTDPVALEDSGRRFLRLQVTLLPDSAH